MNRILEAHLTTPTPYITVAAPGELLSRRCEPSFKDVEDLNHLFLETVHSPLQRYKRGGEEISSFYVKRSRHIAVFGELNLTGARQETPRDLSSAARVSAENVAADFAGAAPIVDEQAQYHDQHLQSSTSDQIIPYVRQVQFKWEGKPDFG